LIIADGNLQKADSTDLKSRQEPTQIVKETKVKQQLVLLGEDALLK